MRGTFNVEVENLYAGSLCGKSSESNASDFIKKNDKAADIKKNDKATDIKKNDKAADIKKNENAAKLVKQKQKQKNKTPEIRESINAARYVLCYHPKCMLCVLIQY